MSAKSIFIFLHAVALSWLLVAPAAAITPAEARLVERVAADGNAGAQVLLAGMHLRGEGGYARDPAKAVQWYERAAIQGNAYAAFMLGELFDAGSGVERNLKLAADWREKAANRGHHPAQLKLAKMYLVGEGVERDQVKGEYWLERAAVEGNSEAQFLLAKIQRERVTTSENRKRADSLLAKAVAQGYAQAIEYLHLLEFAEFQLDEAWHRRIPDLKRLAEDGDHDAQYQIGLHYAEGSFGSEKDNGLALHWFTRAAEGGNVAAMTKLAQIYAEGLYGVMRNPQQAALWGDRARAAPR